MKAAHYLIAVVGDVEPVIAAGPGTDDVMLEAARNWRHDDPSMRDGLFLLRIGRTGKPTISAWTGGDFPDSDEAEMTVHP